MKPTYEELEQKIKLLEEKIDCDVKFASYFKNNKSIMLQVDTESKQITNANEAAVNYYGYPKEKLLKKSINDLQTLSIEEINKLMKKAVKQKSNHFQFKHILANGELRDVEVYSSPFKVGDKINMIVTVHDVSDRIVVEQKLRKQNEELIITKEKIEESEDKYKIITNSTIDIVYMSDLFGNLLFLNKQHEKIFGRTNEEVIGTNIAKYVPAKEFLNITKILKQIVSGEKIISYKSHVYHKNGDLIPVELNGRIVKHNNKRVLIGAIRDLREEEKAKKTINESEQKFQSVVNSMDDMIFVLDKDNRFIDVYADSDLLFVDTELFIGKKRYDIMPKHVNDLYDKAMINVKQGLTEEFEYSLEINKELIWYALKLTPLFEDAVLSGSVAVVRDITDKVKIETALKESEAKYRLLVENQSDLIVKVDMDGRFIFVSQSYCNMFGKTEEELIGQVYMPLIHEDDRESTEQEIQKLHKSPYKVYFEQRAYTKNGIKWLSWMDTSVLDENGNVIEIIGVGRDISEQKEIEVRLRNILESSTNLFYSHTPEHMLTYVSPKFEDVLGYTSKEMMQKWTDTASDNSINNLGFQITQKAIDTGIAQPPFELELLHKNGRKVWVEVREAPVVENGKTISIVGALVDISDRKKIETALKESEAKLRHIIDNSSNLFYSHTRDHVFTYISPQFKQTLGYTDEELLVNWTKLATDSPINALAYDKTQKGIDTGVAQPPYEVELQHKNGSRILLEVREVPVVENGKTVSIVGALIDITETRAARNALKESEAKHRMFFENAPIGIIHYDNNGVITEANDSIIKTFGTTREKLINLDINNIPNKKFANEIIKSLKGEIGHFEGEYTSFSGNKTAFIQSDWFPIHNDNVFISGVGIIKDITNEKRIERDYRHLFDNTTEAIYILDKNGLFLDVNQGVIDMYGYSKDEFIGKTPEFLSAPNKNNMQEIIIKLEESYNGTPQQFDFWGIRKNGEEFLKIVRTQQGYFLGQKVIITFALDITNRHDDEEKILKQNKQLKALNATKNKFFSIIAHDLRSPFNSILGFSELLTNNFDEYDTLRQKEFVDIIHQGAKKTFKLLENLLLWARTQGGNIKFNMKKINIYTVSQKSINLLTQAALDKGISLKNSINNNIGEEIYVMADTDMAHTIIRNLLSNAIKFTPKNGEIIFNTSIIKNSKEKEFVEISIKDSGVGMNKEKIKHLFDISKDISTVGTEGETGTGLGLTLCKDFVEKHGGTIHVESELGKGSIFIFTLPLA